MNKVKIENHDQETLLNYIRLLLDYIGTLEPATKNNYGEISVAFLAKRLHEIDQDLELSISHSFETAPIYSMGYENPVAFSRGRLSRYWLGLFRVDPCKFCRGTGYTSIGTPYWNFCKCDIGIKVKKEAAPKVKSGFFMTAGKGGKIHD